MSKPSQSSQKEPQPRFTGLWIPVEVLEIPGLNHTDQMILAWIHALKDEDMGGCYASNAYFCKWMRCDERTIRRSISKLVEMKIVISTNPSGNQRLLNISKKSASTIPPKKGGGQKCPGGGDKNVRPISTGTLPGENQPDNKEQRLFVSSATQVRPAVEEEALKEKVEAFLRKLECPETSIDVFLSKYSLSLIADTITEFKNMKKSQKDGIGEGKLWAYFHGVLKKKHKALLKKALL